MQDWSSELETTGNGETGNKADTNQSDSERFLLLGLSLVRVMVSLRTFGVMHDHSISILYADIRKSHPYPCTRPLMMLLRGVCDTDMVIQAHPPQSRLVLHHLLTVYNSLCSTRRVRHSIWSPVANKQRSHTTCWWKYCTQDTTLSVDTATAN